MTTAQKMNPKYKLVGSVGWKKEKTERNKTKRKKGRNLLICFLKKIFLFFSVSRKNCLKGVDDPA